MNQHWPIRVRLTVWYTGALAAGLAIFGLAVWFSMRHSLNKDLDRSLQERARSVESFIATEIREPDLNLPQELDEYSRAFPRDAYLQVTVAAQLLYVSDRSFPFSSITGPDLTLQDFSRTTWRGRNYRLYRKSISIDGKPGQVTFAFSLQAIEELLNRLRNLLIALTPAVILMAGLGGFWLNRRALKPVDEIVATAQFISINNLSGRLPVSNTGDELQRLSETWNSMLSRLEAAVKRLSRFSADVSHELRTPLAIIRTTAEIAARRSRSAESYRSALDQIVSESERLTQLVDDLLFLARCDSEVSAIPFSRQNLSALVSDLVTQTRGLAGQKRIVVSGDIEQDLSVEGNELALRRLGLALLSNAIQYSSEEGRVHVRLFLRDGRILFEVQDQGAGIPASEQKLIFERFYRSESARRSEPGGLGLGLSLAAGIAQRHGAQIEVQSEPGHGSCFRVTFPKTLAPASPDTPSQPNLYENLRAGSARALE